MRLFYKLLTLLAFVTSTSAYALTFTPDGHTEVFGDVFTVTPQKNDTFSRYARIYDVGAYAIQRANPGINEDYPDKQKQKITIPGAFILPSKRDGIVINLPELRLYYFTPTEILTYPVSIGRAGWQTPIREATIVEKIPNPSWHVPDSIRAESEAKGHPLPDVVPAGPKNPLGKYAMRLNLPGYLIHGTNVSPSIGRRVSHGCIRLFPADIEELFKAVPVGTTVSLINEPIKVGWKSNELYLEVHPLLQEFPMSESDRQALVTDKINAALNGKSAKVDWTVVEKMMKEQSGIVAVIAK
jgi:L,D-transpeptidase ErfK/SrfK